MKWIVAQSYNDYFKANIALTKLQNEGIDALLKDENTVTIDPMLGNAIGGIKLMILEKDTDEVIAIFKSWDEEAKALAKCPKCGNNDLDLVTTQTPENFIMAIFTAITANYALADTHFKCNRCKHKFNMSQT
jgi:DNA-directed RNA polymerase subunit M/transcription elongation factor TFIIS